MGLHAKYIDFEHHFLILDVTFIFTILLDTFHPLLLVLVPLQHASLQQDPHQQLLPSAESITAFPSNIAACH